MDVFSLIVPELFVRISQRDYFHGEEHTKISNDDLGNHFNFKNRKSYDHLCESKNAQLREPQFSDFATSIREDFSLVTPRLSYGEGGCEALYLE